jgi:hypothetical protein
LASAEKERTVFKRSFYLLEYETKLKHCMSQLAELIKMFIDAIKLLLEELSKYHCEQEAKGLHPFVRSHSLFLLPQDFLPELVFVFFFWQLFPPQVALIVASALSAWHSTINGCAIIQSRSRDSM